MRRNTRLVAVLFLLADVTCIAATKNIRFRITVLDAQSKTLSTDPDTTPRDCDQVNYSGYCHESKAVPVRNTMRVQEGNSKPFDITCLWDNHWSKCVALPIGRTFDARQDKHGITIFYEDEKGGASKQLYTVVAAVQASPSTAAPASSQTGPTQTGLAPKASTKSSPGPATTATNSEQAATPAPTEINREKIKCNFNSTPAGAEIT